MSEPAPTSISMSIQGETIDLSNAALAQVGWLGQTGTVYGLHESPQERGGFTPLYIQVGTWHVDDDGRRTLED